jgi:uncharacterized protein YkwD
MPRRLAALALLALTVTPSALAASRDATLESSLLAQINEVRSEHALPPLKLSAKLAAAAQQHTEEMGADGYFAHESVDHSVFWKRVSRWYPSSGWAYWSVGENLLWASPDVSPSGAVTMWMNSPEHRANLLSKTWREIGLSAVHFDAAPGTYGGQPVTILTADFGARR